MPTRDQLARALMQAHQAGDTESATYLAGLIRSNQYDDTTLLGRGAEFLKGIPRGFAASYASAIEGTGELADVAGLAEDDNELTLFGRRASDAIMDSLGAAPGYEDLWTTKFGDALGSLASFFTPGVALKALGYAGKAGRMAAGAGLGATMTAGTGAQRVQQARAQGIDVSEETEDKAVMLNALVGVSEIMPIEKILRGIPAEALSQPFMKSFWPRFKSALGSGSVEAVQEVGSGLAQDAIEKGLYNPDLPIGQSAWDDLTLGGAAGATADLLLNALAGRRVRGITEQQREIERELRAREAERLELAAKQYNEAPQEGASAEPVQIAGLLPYTPEAVSPESPVTSARRMAEGVDFPIGATFTSLDADGNPSLEVRNQAGEVLQRFDTPENAGLFAAKLNEESINRSVDEAIDLSIGQSDVDYTTGDRLRLRSLGRRLFHPAENNFTREQINYAGGTTLERGYENESLTAQEAIDAGISPQKMTIAQRINAKRLRNGQRESNTFSVAEARAALKDNFGALAEFDAVQLGANETFSATKDGDNWVVKSNLGEVVRSRPSTATEQLESGEKRVAFKRKKEADNYAAYLNGKKNSVIRRSELRDEAEITPAEIASLLKAKNISSGLESPEVRHMAEAVTGHKARGKTAIADMSAGERAMLYRKLRSLPSFQKPTQLPDFRPRPYSPAQYRYAKQATLEAAGKAQGALQGDVVPSREQIEERAGPLSEQAYQRLRKDLSLDSRLKRDIEVEQNRARQLAAREKVLRRRQQQEEFRQRDEALKAQQVKRDEYNRVMRALSKNLRGFGMDRVGLKLMDEVRTQAKDAASEGVETEGGYSRMLNEVFIAIEALKRHPDYVAAAEDQKTATLERLAVDTLNHEVVHAMRQADLFTDVEWQTLERAARSARKQWEDGGGTRSGSYTEWAAELYSDLTPVDQMEEAIAEMVRDAVSGRLKISGRPRSLLRRIVEFLKGIVGIKAEGYDNLPQIIEAVRTGEIGARSEGEIRTLRETERFLAEVPERGIVRRMTPEEAVEIEQEETELEAEETGPPPKAEAVPGQSSPDFVERRVWHGSPYVYAKPDLSKNKEYAIDSFGWGYYVADSRKIANEYAQKAVSGADYLQLKGIPEDQWNEVWGSMSQKERDAALLEAKEVLGNIYEIELDDAAVERMLDWDAPLADQAELLPALRKVAKGRRLASESLQSFELGNTTGGSFYRALSRDMEDEVGEEAAQRAASKALSAAGVAGMKYLDAASAAPSRQAARAQSGIIMPFVHAMQGRKEREPTRNYVVFDEKSVQLVARNGQPIEQVVKEQVPGAEQLQEQAGLTDVMFSRRLARAQEQGFDVSTVWYHGTHVPNIDEFYNKRGVAGFFSRDPDFASRFAPVDDPYSEPFAGGGLVYPVFLRAKNTFDPANKEQLRELDNLISDPANERRLEEGVRAWMQEFRPGWARDDTRIRNAIIMARTAVRVVDRGGYDWVELERLAPAIRAAGYDSYVDYEFAGQPATGLAVFERGDIKGVFAEFDPDNVPEGREYADDIMYSRRGVAKYRPERISNVWSEHGYASGRAKSALAYINPLDFIDLTTASALGASRIREEAGELDRERIAKEIQTPFLSVTKEDGGYRVTSHEGRHRMAAMARAGVRRAPVVLRTDWTGYDDTTTGLTDGAVLRGQTFYDYDPSREVALVSDVLDITIDNWAQIKEVFGGEGDVMFSRRRVSTTGKYVGAPPGVNSPQRLGALLTKVKKLADEGEPGRFWYERSGQAVLNFVGGDINEAERLLKAIAITSVGTRVDLNFRFALQAYLQDKAGFKVRSGRRPADMSKKMQAVFDGKAWDGVNQKTKNFYNNLMSEIDPSKVLWEKGDATEHGVTTDIWMMRAFGFYRDNPTAAQYKFVADEVKKIADELGWTPHQVQAAIWVAMKARSERPAVKKATNELSIKKGWARRERDKNGKPVLKILDAEKHAKNWVQQSMKTDPTAEDTAQANFGYDDAIDNTLGQISWESAPGSTTGHLQELLSAPMEVRKEFHAAMASAFRDEQGRDILAKALGLPSPGDFEGPGYWEGQTSPSTQTRAGLPLQYKGDGYEIEQSAETLIDAYIAARGILMRQDAIGWHRPFFDDKLTVDKANGIEVDIGRGFTEEEILQLGALLESRANQDMFNPVEAPALVAVPNGVRILNNEKKVSNQQFREIVESALSELNVDNRDVINAKWFRYQGNLISHDWKGGSNGQGYLQSGRLTGRPDLQERVRRVLAQIEPRVKAVEQEFVERYGWTAGPDLVYSRRSAGAAVRPGNRGAQGDQQGLVLSGRAAPGARTFQGVHYGKGITDVLEADRYGTGIRGAERRRLAASDDPRIRRRVYFYIESDYSGMDEYRRGVMEGRELRPEAGLGPHVYTQTFGNILDVDSAVANRFRGLDENAFESAVIDAGYDGYAVPHMGMMVILNHDVPANYQGPHYELEQQGIAARRDRTAAIVAENTSAAKRTTATSFVPNDSHRASPEAQYIARHPDEALRVPDDLKRSLRPANYVPVATEAVPSERTPYAYYDMAAGALSTPSRFQYYVDKVRQQAINKYARLERLNWTTHLRENLADTSSIAAALHSDRSLGVVAAAIKYGVPVYENGIIHVKSADEGGFKSLIEIMAPLYSERHGNLKQAAQDYAIAQRSEKLRNDGKKVPVTAAEEALIEARIAPFVDENGNNIIKQWYRDWQTYNEHVITMAQRAGILTEETANLWRSMADYYPFYRVAEGGGKLFRQGQKVFGGLTAAMNIRKLKGGESPINMDLEEAISLNLSAMIQMSMKNIAQQRIVRDMKELGLAEEIAPGQPSAAPVVEFRVAGRKRRFAIYDPLVYESMLPMDGTEVVAFIKHTFGLPATALRELVTRDPGFMAVNLLRDSLSSFVTSGANLVPIASTFKGLFDGVERLEKMGVVGGYDYSNDPDNIAEFFGKELQKHHIKGANGLNPFKRLWELAGRGTTASDAATRNAVFDDVWARTGNLAEASFQAMEVINFGRRGRNPLIRILSAVIPFLNARIQGVDLIYRAGVGMYTANREKNRQQVAAAAIARGSLLMGATALYWMLVSDDDQYKEAPDFAKDNYWIIPTPWNVPVMLPIPFEIGLIFKTIPETVLDTTYGERTKKEAAGTLGRGVMSTLEVSPFQIQFMGPILEATSNYNSFTGRQVVPQYLMDGRTEGLQSTLYTSELAKTVGQALNISPMKIDHVISGYSGTIGQYFFDWLDVGLKSATLQGDNRSVMPSRKWYEYPMIKRFAGQENASGLVQDAYDLYRDVDKAYSTMNMLRKEGRQDELVAYLKNRQHLIALRGPVNNVKEALDQFRRQKEAITRSDMPAAMKREQIDELEAMINTMLKGIVPQLKEAANPPFYETTF